MKGQALIVELQYCELQGISIWLGGSSYDAAQESGIMTVREEITYMQDFVSQTGENCGFTNSDE